MRKFGACLGGACCAPDIPLILITTATSPIGAAVERDGIARAQIVLGIACLSIGSDIIAQQQR